MTHHKLGRYNHSELRLGDQSKIILLRNLIEGLGFTFSGADSITGLSGLHHTFDAIGTRDQNILLVVGGAEKLAKKENLSSNPRIQMENWRNNSLLSAYDVQSVLSQEGLVVDLMFFHNINYKIRKGGNYNEFEDWVSELGLPHDIELSYAMSVNEIFLMSTEELANAAQSIGASFLTLDSLSAEDIISLTHKGIGTDVKKDILSKLRLLQYFEPPTDELLLSAYDLSGSQNKDLPKILFDTSKYLGHEPSANVLVPFADFNDPISTAKELENNKYIDFSHDVEISETGIKVTQSIRKTAQGSFVIRILNSLGLPEFAKAIVQAIKGE
jgi:hypothetical protein